MTERPTVELLPTGGARITIPKNFLGHCMCGRDATTTVWCEFNNPRLYPPELVADLKAAGLPHEPPKGIWHSVCDDCLEPDAIIKQD